MTRNPVGKYTGNELRYVKAVLQSDLRSATGGSWNKRLETTFARKFKSKYAIAHNSGTSALHSCLKAAGVKPGDEIISPALTVIINTFVTLYMNAVPVYADIDPETFTIDPKDLERKITKRTRAIMVVAVYGLPADMDPIMKIARKHKLIVIEDNAQCYLSTYKGRLAGTIGDMAMFSFENSKHISVGEGGIVTTNNRRMAEDIRKFGGIGYKNLRAEEGRVKLNEGTFQDPNYKRHDTLGYNYRLTEVCAAIGLAQLERLDELVSKRRMVAKFYDEAIKGCSWLIPQKTPRGYTNSYFTYAVRYEGEKITGASWKEFYRLYKKNGGDGFYAAWSVPYLEPVIANRNFEWKKIYKKSEITYRKGLCPVAEDVQPKLMQFKTNYRDMNLAKRKALALKKTIEEIRRRQR